MQKKNTKTLICSSLIVGGLFSILSPIYLIENHIYSDVAWMLLTPGWMIFSVGAHDLVKILIATIFDTFVFGLVAHVIIWGLIRFVSQVRYQ